MRGRKTVPTERRRSLPIRRPRTPEQQEQFEEERDNRIMEKGTEVAYQDWDSGGPGAGAGRLSVYRYRGQFYVFHDAGMMGPYATLRRAAMEGGIERVNDATTAIWRADRGLIY
jgi:hypothetical protein